ncbi:MAG: hypothetical protein DI637_01600 [Citromicrobium sp.]|nr:MAG: hypothetical protein DI637_01600 [Citromicrobium sp.]
MTMARLPAAGSLLVLVPAIASGAPVHAQQNGVEIASSSGQQNRDPESRTIVVEGRRWGKADVDAEAEIGETEIDSFAATTIGELLGAIAPQIDSSGGAPEVLVNGKRIANPAELEDYPKEALARIAILPKEAAAAYGFEPEKRVVNLELKRRFATWNAEVGTTLPTADGRTSNKITVGRFTIDHDTRWNVDANLSHDSELLRSERALPIRPEIRQLVETLGESGAAIDPDDFESLLPPMQSLGVNANVTRPIGTFSATANLSAGRSKSVQKIGLPVALVKLPPGHPLATGSPSMGELGFLVPGGALENVQESENLGMGVSLSGPVAGWQSTLGLRYSANWSRTARETGFDSTTLQAIVDSGGTPAIATVPPDLLIDGLSSRTDTYNLSLTTSNAIATLPAGDVRASIALNASRFRTRSSNFTSATGASADLAQNSAQHDGLLSLSLPVASTAGEAPSALGELTASSTVAFRKVSGAAANYRIGGALDWSPSSLLNLRASYSRENSEPTYDQLYAPRVELLNRIFDFSLGEYVRPVFRFGGNAGLEGGSLHRFSADLAATPFDQNLLTLNLGYRQSVSRGGVASFPSLTPDVEAAFPERVFRDSAGRLVAIDARPINIESERTKRLTNGLSLFWTQQPNSADASSMAAAFTPWTITGSLSHQWELESRTEFAQGLGVIDRLEGTGQPRHSANFHLNVGRKGLGGSVSGTWIGAARVDGRAGVAYRYPPSTEFDVGFFIEPALFLGISDDGNWFKALKLSIDVQNLFDTRRSIESAGRTEGFTRDEFDPLGRTIRFGVTAQF